MCQRKKSSSKITTTTLSNGIIDLIVGADGVNFQVKEAMEEHTENLRVSTTLNVRVYV